MNIISVMQKIYRRLPVVMLVAAVLSGCNSPDDYLLMPEISEVAEETPDSQEGVLRQREILDAVAAEPLPPYRVGFGDAFTLRVFDHAELGLDGVAVTPDGWLAVSMIGAVKIGGLTLPEATEVISKALSKHVREPLVTLIPMAINSHTATVSGKVRHAGSYSISDGMRLSELIAKGQGFPESLSEGMTIELADLANSIFVRDGKMLPIDFEKALRGDPLHNVLIRRGDYVNIATRADKLISVIGEVGQQRYVVWYENIGILEAIASARGLLADRWDYLLVIRGGVNSNPKVYRVDLNALLSGRIRNPRLLPGDVVYVPKDNLSEYNVFIRKLMPTGQLINMLITPGAFFLGW